MEYEKSPSATTFSRKMNNRSRSLSFSANAIYDGVFTSPANSKSSMVDYSEIFRGSGPSPSSIPFLDVPELNGGKIKVDVRSTKLDYSSVFGGFGVCDFDGTPKEVIIKSEKKTSKKEDKRNRRKSGNSSEVPRCDEGKNRISSPEMVRMKHSDISHNQAGLRNENGTTQASQVFTMPGPAPSTQSSQVFTMPGSAPTTQPSKVFTMPGPAPTTQPSKVFTMPGPAPTTQPSQVFTRPGPAPAMQPSQVFTMPPPAPVQLVDNVSPLKKIESKAPVSSVEKETCPVAVEEVKVSRKRNSKSEVDFGEIFGRNGSSTLDNFTRKTASVAEHHDVKPFTSLQHTFTGENGASERLTSMISGISERYQTEDTGSPGSPVFFDAESDSDSSAAESSAALKKALEEAQVRMNIAKQMMGRKKSGFLSSPKLKSCDGPKGDDKRDTKIEEIIEESGDENSHILDELVNSSEQSFSNEGDQHAKKARKQWEVPEGVLKSTPEHTQEEVKEQEVVKQAEIREQEVVKKEEVSQKEVVKQKEVTEQEVVKQEDVNEKEVVKQTEEHARRGRKHWELPGGIFKSVMNGKQHEPDNIAPTTPENDSKQEVQPLTENPFYTFGQLGNKLKCVVEAFTGSKVSQKDETQVTEKENSFLTHIFQVEESDSQEMLAGIPVMETHLREVEETPQQTESRSETKSEDNSESTMYTFTEECSQKMEKETEWQVKSACESNGGPQCVVKDFQENPEPTYNFLDQEGEREIVTETQEMIVGPDDTRTYVRELEEIPTPSESLSTTQFGESVGAIVSLHKENTSEPENINEEKATEQKAPRRRRVWKTSEDVYNMIKSPIGNNRPWKLESTEEETTDRPFLVEGVRIHDASKEIESTPEQANDSGLQENWTVLKQMFRQMFQTGDNKGEDETYCLVESEKDYIDIHKRIGDGNGKETTETSYCQMTGADIYEHNAVETVESEFGAYTHIRENEDLKPAQETFCRKVDGKVEVQGKTALVRELIGEELETTEIASDQEGEDVQEVFEEAGWPQGFSEFDEVKELADSRGEMLEYDGSETDSNESCEKFEQRQELAEETKINGSIDTDTSRSSFEMRQGDSYIEEVGVEQDLSDQFHEKNSAVSSTEEHVEEIDSDSIQSGWSVIDDEDKIKSYVEESLAAHLQDGGASTPEEKEETKEETDEMNSSLGVESNEDKTEQEHQFECQTEEMGRSNVEPAESSCCLPKEDEKISATADRNVKDNDGEESCRSSMEEEGDAASSASQNEAEQVDEHLKKKNEAKEKEREREKERVMVERAIREARERAFADARERAGKAAIEKAKAKAHRKGTSEVPRRSEKGGSVEVNEKLSSTEKASMQAKLRAERAAVERALSEARERAMEKALSGKSAASQTRSYGGSKSFSTSGEKRSSSSSGTENKNSGPSSSSNQTAKGEPIQRCKARSERHQRTSERAAEALAEKKLRDLKAQKEQSERNRFAESLDADVKRWSSGKESNLRALLSTLQYILGAESGWKPIPLTDLVASAAVRKAYRKATLYVHPDKLQQRGASTQQKYICEKVFDLLKEAWNKFGADDK